MVSTLPPNHEHFDDRMIKMKVNLDDIPRKWLEYVMDLLFYAGANHPDLHEKDRPGVLLQLLCPVKTA